jgi:beta-galactosidase
MQLIQSGSSNLNPCPDSIYFSLFLIIISSYKIVIMKPVRIAYLPLMIVMALIININVHGQSSDRKVQNFNFDWKFYKGDIPNGQNPGLNDAGWRSLDLPHDWSIEGPFSKEYASATGFLPGGTGWYRKSFLIPANEKNRKVFISFDGIYNNSEVWINGTYLGKRPNGYISFQYDLTPFIKFGKENLIAVKVDHTKFGDSRWYTGSGIYRDVKLIFTSPLHIKQWGVFASAKEVSIEKATLDIEVNILNESGKTSDVTVSNYLFSGRDTVKKITQKISIPGSSPKVISQKMEIFGPRLWDVDNPNLYSLLTIVSGKGILDSQTTVVGFRNFSFDADKGFILNGKNLKLKGICMHHDAGTLGSAVPRQVLERRLDILKELGCNAIRTSHNPFSSDFLELCDKKGFLVIGEAFDEWESPKKKWIKGWNKGTPGKDGYAENFKEWARTDLKDMILRDRNHPSIIMWSIGNEVDYPNDPYTHPVLNTEANPQTWAKFDEKLPHADRLGEVARELVAIVKQLDTTRPVTAGLASALMSNETGYADALDVAGYNYQEFRYAPDHLKYPKRILYGSENGMSLEAWNSVTENDYVVGQFLWTGFEYLGEAGQFPSRHSTSGIIDLAGNKKPEFYFRQSLWSDKPMVFIGTTDRLTDNGPVNLWSHKRVDPVWNWKQGQPVSVNVFTNCAEVELYLNDKSLGIKKMADFQNRTITWEVPFESGTLKAVARTSGKELASYELKTTGVPVRINAKSDVASLRGDKQDVSHVFVTLCDNAGNTVYSSENEVICEVTGPVRILGMEDSNPRNIEDYKDNKQKAYHGKMLIYIQSLDETGKAVITLSSPGLQGATVEINVVK